MNRIVAALAAAGLLVPAQVGAQQAGYPGYAREPHAGFDCDGPDCNAVKGPEGPAYGRHAPRGCGAGCVRYREPPYPGADHRRDWGPYDGGYYPPPYGYTYGSANGYGYGYSYPPRWRPPQAYPGAW